MEVTTPESLYKPKYELETLTSEELIKTHNELVNFLYKIQDDIYNQIDLIKIDIEGYEVKAIEGMKNLLINKRINTIFMDYHMNIITHQDKEKCEKFILSCGYKKINTETEDYICYKLI